MTIFNSPAKIVFLYIAGILGGLTAFACGWDLVHGQFSDITKLLLVAFTNAVSLTMGFYFGDKGDSNQPLGGK